MSTFWSQPPRTVRPRSRGNVPVMLCLLVFCLTVAVVYRGGRQRWQQSHPGPSYTATAYVGAVKGDSPIFAETKIGTVPVRDQRSRLYGNQRIPIAFTGKDQQRAVDGANALADLLASQQRSKWRDQLDGPRLKARQTADRVRQEYAESLARHEVIERQAHQAATGVCVRKDSSTVKGDSPIFAGTKIGTVPTAPPAMIDNPQWLELQQVIAKLQQRREELLVDRTPLHPAVGEIDDQIANVEGQLAAIPRQVRDPKAPAAGTVESVAKSPVDDRAERQAAERVLDNQRALEASTAEVEWARRACQEAELAATQIEKQQQAGPQITVEHAKTANQDMVAADGGWRRLILSALAAGSLMGLGLAMASFGAALDPAVASVAEVAGDLGAPVLGVVPAEEPMADPLEPYHQRRIRRAAIAVGVLLIAACPVAAVWGIARV